MICIVAWHCLLSNVLPIQQCFVPHASWLMLKNNPPGKYESFWPHLLLGLIEFCNMIISSWYQNPIEGPSVLLIITTDKYFCTRLGGDRSDCMQLMMCLTICYICTLLLQEVLWAGGLMRLQYWSFSLWWLCMLWL